MTKLTEQEYRVARALVATENLSKTQAAIGAELGLDQTAVTRALQGAVFVLGIPDEAGSHVRRQRLALAAHRAGGFDQLAASLGLYDRDGESVQ